jgi:hypothetical protein
MDIDAEEILERITGNSRSKKKLNFRTKLRRKYG